MKMGVWLVRTMCCQVDWTPGRIKTHFLRRSRSRFGLLSWLLYFDRLDWLGLLDGLWVGSFSTSTSWPGLNALTSGSSEISTFLLRLRVSLGWGGASSMFLYIHTTLYSSFELLEYQGETPVRLHIDCMTMTVNQANGHHF